MVAGTQPAMTTAPSRASARTPSARSPRYRAWVARNGSQQRAIEGEQAR